MYSIGKRGMIGLWEFTLNKPEGENKGDYEI